MAKQGTLASALCLEKKYQEESMKEEKRKLVLIGKIIINKMVNGIKYDDGRQRKFDIIDFYSLSPFSFDELFYIIRDNLTIDEIRFYRRNQNILDKKEKLSLQILYGTRNVYDVKYDKKNQFIEGSGREVTKEEKENLVNLLISKNIPLYKNVYEAAFDRWKNGFLEMPTKFYPEEEITRKRILK